MNWIIEKSLQSNYATFHFPYRKHCKYYQSVHFLINPYHIHKQLKVYCFSINFIILAILYKYNNIIYILQKMDSLIKCFSVHLYLACIFTSLLFIGKLYFIVWVVLILFSHLSIDGNLGFLKLAIVNNAAVNIHMQDFVCNCVFPVHGYISRMKLLIMLYLYIWQPGMPNCYSKLYCFIFLPVMLYSYQ
jgi:hypothetical protein